MAPGAVDEQLNLKPEISQQFSRLKQRSGIRENSDEVPKGKPLNFCKFSYDSIGSTATKFQIVDPPLIPFSDHAHIPPRPLRLCVTPFLPRDSSAPVAKPYERTGTGQHS